MRDNYMISNLREVNYRSIKGLFTAIVLFCFEIMVCLIYGFRFGYSQDNNSSFVPGDAILVTCLIILAIVGFGIMNSYITNFSFSGMAMSLLIFAITVQHYFLVRAFWYKTGLYSPNASNTFADRFDKISFANVNQEPYVVDDLDHASLADAIACAICMILTFSPVIGRIQFVEAFFMSLIGTTLYELNYHVFFRIRITDTGYGMRVFLFAGIAALFSGLILNKRQTTLDHPGYVSNYVNRGLGLFGFILTFCTFPYLCVAGLYRTSTNNSYMAFIAPLNMYLALGAGVLGCFAASCLTSRKILIHDLIFTGLNGGIVYSSSADISRNPAVPLTCGFVIGVLGSLFHSKVLRRMNKRGVFFSLSVFHRLIIPGVFSGILSAVLMAVDQASKNSFVKNIPSYRTSVGQGGFQLVGVLLTLAVSAAAGLLIGGLYRLVNFNEPLHQFNDGLIYSGDRSRRQQQQQSLQQQQQQLAHAS